MPAAKRAARKSVKAAPKRAAVTKRTPAKAPAKGSKKKTPVKKTTTARKAAPKTAKKEKVDPSTVFGTPEWRAKYMKPKRKKKRSK